MNLDVRKVLFYFKVLEAWPQPVRLAKGITGYRFSAYWLRPSIGMESESNVRPAPVVRLRNSVRVELRKDAPTDVRKRFRWDWLMVRVLRDLCNVPASKLFCLQDFNADGFLDVTFTAFADCSTFFDLCSRSPGEEVLRGLRLVPLFVMDEVPITVHLYNPFVTDEDIRIFLGQFCSSVSSGERVRGRFGIWNGKRRFLVKLRVDPSAPGGLLHLPGGFSIGPHRGFLHYPGQPLYCRRCRALGHTKEKCSGRRCRRCGGEDHATAECVVPRTCSLCGSEDHLFCYCPLWKGPAPGPGTAREPEAAGEAGVSVEEAADLPEEQRPPPTKTAGTEEDLRMESQPAERQSAEPTTTEGEASEGFGTTQSTWTPVDWAEALEGVEVAPSPIHPDWVVMEFTDSLTSSSPGPAPPQEPLEPPGCASASVAGTAAVERRQKRSRVEEGREFDLCAVDDTGTMEDNEGKEGEAGGKWPSGRAWPQPVRLAKGITGYRFSAYWLRPSVAMEREGDRRVARVVWLRHSLRIQLWPDAAEDVRKRFG
ncbi:hypothetical protein QTP70_001834 [Hemibagrus guttatus]|uniref:Phorbol-ester/DAG-type domain-containing protein n=1 Tax=Hemibagrus guttatus TaxID=175788 RepID=A0AAE0R6M5_9TELE|nr:hypothetical protein QTP70_001834 [Hemibagrus guttatus]